MTTIISVNEPTTSVTVTESVVKVAVTESPVTVTAATSGPQGAVGQGVPAGGSTGYLLTKSSATDYATVWSDPTTVPTGQVHQYVKNSTGATLLKGQAVYISGAVGANPLISLARANTEVTSSKTLGLLEQDLANNAFGYVACEGQITGVDTSTATDGDTIWLSPTTAGGLVYGTANKPSAPNHMVFIGYVLRANANNGVIYVKPQNGFELEELHNVAISSIANNQVIVYDSATSLWKNEAAPVFPTFTKQDTLAPYVGTGRYYFDETRTVTQLRASVGTAPTGSSIVVTVNKNGSSIGTVTIPAGSYTATSTVNVGIVANDYLTVSIISVGSTVPGSDLTVTITA